MEEQEVAVHVVVSTTSLIPADLQNSITVSKDLTRTVVVKGLNMALIQEPWY